MSSKTKQKKIKNALYLAVFIALFGWLIFWVFSYWNNNAANTKSANNAVVVQTNNGLQNLAKPNVIVPGQTSGNANPLISNYLAAQKQITEQYLEGANFFLHGQYTFKISSLNKQAYGQFKQSSDDIYEITNIITATQKFLEYNPKVDLAPLLNGDESGSNERLDRTKNGLNDVLNAVKASGYSQSQQIEAQISPLLTKVDQITQQNAPQWYKEVEDAQKAILTLINDDFNNHISESSNKLSEIAESYLD